MIHSSSFDGPASRLTTASGFPSGLPGGSSRLAAPTSCTTSARWQVTTMLTAAQCETLADELDFIRDVVNDPVLVGMVDLVAAEAAICARTGDSLILDFEL